MTRYGMVIDLTRCIGCGSCMMSCKAENQLPPGIFWTRVLKKESGKYPAVSISTVPVLCNHCEEAACVKVCPSGATSRQDDGTVIVDYEKCTGCRYCMMACPYGARFYHDKAELFYPGQGLSAHDRISRQEYQTGVVVKCTFCHDRVQEGLKKGLKPGSDREATPICANNCMAKARFFGDLDDPDSEVSVLIRANRGRQLHPEYGTEPSVYYLG
ncbi:MAG: 4Fe-4S dicluster domain-containing protein [Dehalococcoidia bacterium]|nr:4Fe-4S dicluster domain-containing protein [Dehalococcoidia bacterium]MDZ4245583.1 4Fe-4S dicluster domain-containing protein [Dehalococcoidia bacterium]